MKRITESNMVFEFKDEQVFLMEGSELHASVGEGIKTVEFIASLEESRLDFVEAKSSSPQPGNQKDFWGFINEISEKFLHSFALYLSAAIGRHPKYSITGKVGAADNSRASYKFILIINGHQIDWLSPIKDALEANIFAHRQIWKSEVVVMNEKLAKKYHLVRDVKPAH